MNKIYKFSRLRSGFTLIELLVAIAVIAIISAAILLALNPLDKINAANDGKVQSAISSIAAASENYATQHSGFYPAVLADLTGSSDLRILPTAPTGYTAYVLTALPATPCTAGTTCVSVTISGQLKAAKWGTNVVQKYESTTGKTCQVATVGTACP